MQQLKPALFRRFHLQSLGLIGSVGKDDFSPASELYIIMDSGRPIGNEFIDFPGFILAFLTMIACLIVGLPIGLVKKVRAFWFSKPFLPIAGVITGVLLLFLFAITISQN